MVIEYSQGFSSVGRASVSKTEGRGFESLSPCQIYGHFCSSPQMLLEMFFTNIYTRTQKSEVLLTNIFKFIQQSRQEASKIVWPTRRETITTTAMVFVMVAILATFFLITDSIISFLLRIILSLSF